MRWVLAAKTDPVTGGIIQQVARKNVAPQPISVGVRLPVAASRNIVAPASIQLMARAGNASVAIYSLKLTRLSGLGLCCLERYLNLDGAPTSHPASLNTRLEQNRR